MRTNRATTLSAVAHVLMRTSGAVLGAVAAAFLARGLGPSGFGWFATGLAVAGVTSLASDMGITQVATRLISTSEGMGRPIAVAAVRARLVIAIPLTAVSMLVLIPQPAQLRPATVLTLLSIPIACVGTFQAVLQAEKRFARIGRATLVQSIVWAAGAGVCWRLSAPPVAYGAAFLAAATLQSLDLLIGATSTSRSRRTTGPAPPVRGLLRASRAVGFGSIAWSAMQRAPVVLAATMAAPSQAALVGAASRVADALYLAPASLAIALLPVFADRQGDPVRQARVVDSAVGLALAAGGSMVVAVQLAGPALGRALFGRDLEDFPTVAVLIVLSVVPFFLDVIWGAAAISRSDGRLLAWTGTVGFAVVVGLGVPLTAVHGAIGSSVALLVAQTVRTGLLGWHSRSSVGCGTVARWVSGGVTVAGASAVAAFASDRMADSSSLGIAAVAAALGIAFCAGLALATRLVRGDDLRRAGVLRAAPG